MSSILDSIEIDDNINQIVNIAIGSNVSDKTDNKISMMAYERDKLLCREISQDDMEYENQEIDEFWDNVEKFQ